MTPSRTYLANVFPYPVDVSDKQAHKRADYRRACALHLFHHGKGHDNPAVAGTVWAAYNGVTEFVDHARGTQSGSDHSSRRLHSVWFGQGAGTKSRALSLAGDWVHR
jgi:hypothetical protein